METTLRILGFLMLEPLIFLGLPPLEELPSSFSTMREPPKSPERIRVQLLQSTRTTSQFLETNIELLEKILDSNVFTGADASGMREEVMTFRAKLKYFKQVERELLDMQPGGYTAPPPRAVKPK